jgi:hypothetical protein
MNYTSTDQVGADSVRIESHPTSLRVASAELRYGPSQAFSAHFLVVPTSSSLRVVVSVLDLDSCAFQPANTHLSNAVPPSE